MDHKLFIENEVSCVMYHPEIRQDLLLVVIQTRHLKTRRKR